MAKYAKINTSEPSSSTTGYTPTHTTTQSPHDPSPNSIPTADLPPPFSTDGGIGSAPEAGGTYMIRHVNTGLAVTMSSGELVLRADTGTDGGWRWRCTESEDGWLRFQETVSGVYLGRNGRGGFGAVRQSSKKWDHLLIRPREAGGCNIFAMDWWTLTAMSTKGMDRNLVETKTVTEASRWEFVRV
ncbi:hypothetical protein F5Y11DRAFT_254410 [Daldinia sp. FL1419]|nr:hypothetical protein F5Y11DRAFT_254410 [Daldinia sp. FL1419]